MVPEGWRQVEYREVCEINRENLPPSTDPKQEVTYLDIGSIPEIGHVSEPLSRYAFGDAPSRARRVVRRDDVVVSTVRPYLRAFARMRDPEPDLIASTGFAVLTPTSEVRSDFLFQTVSSHRFLAQLEARMVGSNYPAVSARDVGDATLLLPPAAEQEKIAAILSNVDAAIAAMRKVIEQTERMKKGLLQTLMTRGIGHTRFKHTEIGEIPEKWEVVELAAACEKLTDGTHQSVEKVDDGDVPFLFVSSIRDGKIDTENCGFITNDTYNEISKGREPFRGLVLYTAVGSYGHAAVVSDDRKLAFQRHIAYIAVDPAVIQSRFLAAFLNSPQGRREADRLAVGTSQKSVTLRDLARFRIPIPPEREQRTIIKTISSTEAAADQGRRSAHQLQTLKRGLLQDLLTGRVRVPVD